MRRSSVRAAAGDQCRPRVAPLITHRSGPTGSPRRTSSQGSSSCHPPASVPTSRRRPPLPRPDQDGAAALIEVSFRKHERLLDAQAGSPQMIPPRAVQPSPTIGDGPASAPARPPRYCFRRPSSGQWRSAIGIAAVSREQRDARRLGALLMVHLGAGREVGEERLGKAGGPVSGPNLPTERSVPGAARRAPA